MNEKVIRVCWMFLIVLISCQNSEVPATIEINYGYENWPGKTGTIKSDIPFPEQLIIQNKLELTTGSTGSSFFYKLPLDESDDLKKGRLQATVFTAVEEAQLSLVEYLDLLTTLSKPPRLTDENLSFGDVAFGEIYNEVFKLAFVRNNVLVVVHASTDEAKAIATSIDEKIKNAPEWQPESGVPSFILP
jgi:hypothetical protein